MKRVTVFDDGTVRVRVEAVAASGRVQRAWRAQRAVRALKAALKAAETAYANAEGALRGRELSALKALSVAPAPPEPEPDPTACPFCGDAKSTHIVKGTVTACAAYLQGRASRVGAV